MSLRGPAAAAAALLALAACSRQGAANTAADAPAAGSGGIGAAPSGTAVKGGPFGLAMGQPLSDLKVRKQLDGDSRYDIDPPLTNPEFEEYIAKAPPRTGLCHVSGIGVTHHGDADGAKIRAVLATFAQALDAKYGPHETQAELDSGSQLTAPGQFADGLDKHERTYIHRWSKGTGAHLPAGLQEISAYAKAVDADGTYLQLSYDFANDDACEGGGAATPADAARAL